MFGSIDLIIFMGLLVNYVGLNGLLQVLCEMVVFLYVELVVYLFVDLVFVMLFFGVVLGLFDYLVDLFQCLNIVGGWL